MNLLELLKPNYLKFICIIIICFLIYFLSYKEDFNNIRDIKNHINDTIGGQYNANTTNAIANNLSTLCSIQDTGDSNIYSINDNLDSELKKELTMKDYKLKITSGENFFKKLDILEEKIFQKYYGNDWESEYNKWLKKRENKIKKEQAKMCKNMGFKQDNIISKENIKQLKETIKKNIRALFYIERKRTFNQNITNHCKLKDNDLYQREIEYRDMEETKIEFYNTIINWLYYILLIAIFILLFTYGKLNIFSNFLLYIVLLLLPTVIYPFIFNIFKYLGNIIKENTNSNLPKNAFMGDL